MNGRKIDRKYENFFDTIFVDLTEKLNPFYKSIGVVPNTLTFMSLFVTLIGEYFFYKDKYLIAGIMYLIGYYFDCADGNFARTYDMVTIFGDWFDHISDSFKVAILVYLFYLKLGLSKKLFMILGVISFFFFTFSIHMGCQQLIYNKPQESPALKFMEKLCPNKKIIKYTKYLGCGMFQVVIALIIIFFKQII
jgi:phosphatidylglycerophosphate synthase